jgi:HEAT repeat protein
MQTTGSNALKLVKSPNIVADRNAAAIADIYKALKSLTFYPDGHPQRDESLRQAVGSLQHLLDGREIILAVSRSGFTTTDGGAPVGNNTKAQGLARELFVRRVQRLTILDDVSREDLQAFLQLLTMDPRAIQEARGIEALMHQCAIRGIWANEVDLSVIHQKRKELEEEDSSPHLLDEGTLALPDLLSAIDISFEQLQELPFVELLDLLDEEPSDARYLQLAKMIVSRAEKLMEEGEFEPVVLAIVLVRRHGEDATRSEFQREYAWFTFEQLAGGAMSDYLLDQLQEGDHESNEWIHLILQKLGAKVVYAIIQRICLAEGLSTRKALATALIRIGEPAIPPLIVMLRDERWYVVRNMIAMLGDIGSRDWVGEMQGVAAHPDPRVRKETIRSLAKIGGGDAEQTIVRLLDDEDQGIVRQAIVSLGTIRCRAALEPLLRIVQQRDRLLKTLPVKKDAVQALGLIGDRRATPHLLEILTGSHILAWRRWEELKIAAATALGQLGDESTLPALRSGAKRRGALGAACNDAVDTIERLSEGSP